MSRDTPGRCWHRVARTKFTLVMQNQLDKLAETLSCGMAQNRRGVKVWPTVALMLILCSVPEARAARNTIDLIGLFPMSGGWSGGVQVQPATALAIEQLNADPTVLPNHTVSMRWNDTSCSESGAGVAIGRLIARMPEAVGIFGAGCSSACTPVAFASEAWRLPQVTRRGRRLRPQLKSRPGRARARARGGDAGFLCVHEPRLLRQTSVSIFPAHGT